MARQSGACLPISENNQAFNSLGKDAEIAHEDTAALVKVFEKVIVLKDKNK